MCVCVCVSVHVCVRAHVCITVCEHVCVWCHARDVSIQDLLPYTYTAHSAPNKQAVRPVTGGTSASRIHREFNICTSKS